MIAEEYARDVDHLYFAARSRMSEALGAWVDNDFERAAASAPLACELIGKAALWRKHPTLLLPLESKYEQTLVDLATAPNLASPLLRSIGLRLVLSRLELVFDDVHMTSDRQKRLCDCRNGSIHVGVLPKTGSRPAETFARLVVADCLLLCNVLLRHIGRGQDHFYGDRRLTVNGLLEQRRSEGEHRVARLLGKSQDRLRTMREHLGGDVWSSSARELEQVENEAFSHLIGRDELTIQHECPACEFDGRLIGLVDVHVDMDFDVSDGESMPTPCYVIWFRPRSFFCNVCKLRLKDPVDLEVVRISIESRLIDNDAELGDDFDAAEWASSRYDIDDEML